MKNLAIIPARGGSKGIKRKNLRMLGGSPLIAWTIQAAKTTRSLDRIIVSTDDLEIAEIAKKLNVEVPFIRPKEISTDESSAVDVCKHALEFFHSTEGKQPINVVYLQPTSPFRNSSHIESAMKKFSESNLDSLVTVTAIPHNMSIESQMLRNGQLLKMRSDEEHQLFQRQKKSEVFVARNGPAILISRTEIILNDKLYGKKIGFMEMDKITSIDIDEPIDLKIAERLLPLVASPYLQE